MRVLLLLDLQSVLMKRFRRLEVALAPGDDPQPTEAGGNDEGAGTQPLSGRQRLLVQRLRREQVAALVERVGQRLSGTRRSQRTLLVLAIFRQPQRFVQRLDGL